jgi:hypothetical protein
MREFSLLGLAGANNSVPEEVKIEEERKHDRMKIRQLAKPLIKAVTEHGPSRDELHEMSPASVMDCIEGVRRRFDITVKGYDPWAAVGFTARSLYSFRGQHSQGFMQCKHLLRKLAKEISSLAESAIASLRDSKDCRAICDFLSPDSDAAASPQNAHSMGRIIFDFGHDQGYMPEIKVLNDLKTNLKLLADRLSADPELAVQLFRECPLECQILRDRLSLEGVAADDGNSLDGATLAPVLSATVQDFPAAIERLIGRYSPEELRPLLESWIRENRTPVWSSKKAAAAKEREEFKKAFNKMLDATNTRIKCPAKACDKAGTLGFARGENALDVRHKDGPHARSVVLPELNLVDRPPHGNAPQA